MKQVACLLVALLMLPVSTAHGMEADAINPSIPPCQCVAFRLDDIQDFYLNQAQEAVIRTFEERNASLTVGVIGNYIGDDALLISFLKQRIHSDHFTMEVANHGWNHEDFTSFNKVQQSDLLSKSNERILRELGVSPDVFITPYNRMNNDTLIAMAENGIRVVSANLTSDHMPFIRNVTLEERNSVSAVYHFPVTAKTGDLNDDDTEWLGFGHQETLGSIKSSMQTYGYALVMMHPQEYSMRDGLAYQNKADEEQLQELESLLDAIHDEGYRVVTVSELVSHVTVPEFSEFIAIAIPFVSSITLLMLSRYGLLFSRKFTI